MGLRLAVYSETPDLALWDEAELDPETEPVGLSAGIRVPPGSCTGRKMPRCLIISRCVVCVQRYARSL